MTTDQYLKRVLEAQNLDDDGPEMQEIEHHRKEVEELLCNKFGQAPHIRYGGSKAKFTMIRESYDLDIPCYFEHDDTIAGDTLEDIYWSVADALGEKYIVNPKRSALRLTCKDLSSPGSDLHIDVVPGRFIDDNEDYVFLHQNEGDKERLKTNIQVQVEHIRDSGVRDAIRLLKLWKVRNKLSVKTFVLELLTVKLLKEHKKEPLADQLVTVWTAFRDEINELSVEDPANPDGNDLSKILDEARPWLCSVATRTLQTIEQSGWEAVFGPVQNESDDAKKSRLKGIAVGIASSRPPKPWSPDL